MGNEGEEHLPDVPGDPTSRNDVVKDNVGVSDVKKRKLSSSDPIDVPSSSSAAEQNAPHLPSWVAGGSPARFVAPDELLKMSVAMENLALVHEIAIDPDFSVTDIPVNPIQAAIKENMHRAYWDLLTEDLAKDPPDYGHAFNLLMEIKQTILDDLLSPAHVRLKAEVNSVLDENSLRNKLEQNCIDVRGTGRFIVDLLGRLCAPERDTMVEKLRQEEGVVELIKGIFNLMDIMKNDLTNYAISKNRAAVEEYSAKFEYKEFLKYLDKFPDGSLMTKEWLKLAYHDAFPSTSSDDSQPQAKRERPTPEHISDDDVITVTSKGYLRLIETVNPTPFPETLRIDKGRLAALAEKFLQMNVATSAVFVTCNLAGKQVSESENFKKSLKDQLIIITNDIEEANLVDTLTAICEQCVTTARKSAASLGVDISAEQERALREQIKALAEGSNAIRALVRSRIAVFVEAILRSPSEVPHRLLPGLSVIQSELCAFTARLLRLCVHNRRTFFELYRSMLKEIKATSEST